MANATAASTHERRALGRPRAFDREEALNAAMLVFWRHGFDGTSYTELTEATGMSKPTLYAMFGDKVSLFRKAVVAYSEMSTRVCEAALNTPTAREGVEAFLRLSRGLNPRPGEPVVCFLVQGALTGSPDTQALRDELTSVRRDGTAKLRARLEQAKLDGELPETADAAVIAEYFVAVGTGINVQATAGTSPAQLNQVIAMAMKNWPGRARRRRRKAVR